MNEEAEHSEVEKMLYSAITKACENHILDKTTKENQMNNDESVCEVPFLELLKSVPVDARCVYEVNSTHHRIFPVGIYCQRAYEMITVMKQIDEKNNAIIKNLEKVVNNLEKVVNSSKDLIIAQQNLLKSEQRLSNYCCTYCHTEFKTINDIKDHFKNCKVKRDGENQ